MDYKKLYEQTLAEKKDLEHKLAICEEEQEEESNLYEKTLDENKRLGRQIFGVHTGVLQVEGLLDIIARVGQECEELKKENKDLLEIIESREADLSEINNILGCDENKNSVEEVRDLSKKSDAKSDIIRNMMDVMIKKADIDDGFYIGREWGNKYIDEWNKIVDEELKEVVKDINYMDQVRLETDGYQFDFCLNEESEEEEEDQ